LRKQQRNGLITGSLLWLIGAILLVVEEMVTHFGIPRIFLGIFPHILFKRHVGYWTMSVWPMFTESHSKMIEYVLHKFPRIQLGTGELMTGELATGGIMDFVHIQGKTKGGKQE
jgi:hypothetical protein